MTFMWIVAGLIALAWIGMHLRDRRRKKASPLILAVRQKEPEPTDRDLHVLPAGAVVMVLRARRGR